MDNLSHTDEEGRAKMVDVSAKGNTLRQAVASGRLRMKPDTIVRIKENGLEKGDVLAAARIAGIMAAKKTPELIPLCHPIKIDSIAIDFKYGAEDIIGITAKVKSRGPTGVEMEALTAVAAAALTVYDMVKAIDKGMIIEEICLESKQGGKGGEYRRTKESE
jgi:cyclic pyranopterin phosphate synthase